MGSRALVLWLAAGIGVVLLYSAYKNQSPTGIVKASLGTAPAAPSPAKPATETSVALGAPSNVNGVAYITDTYGTPITPLPTAYQVSPGTYRPPNVGTLA